MDVIDLKVSQSWAVESLVCTYTLFFPVTGLDHSLQRAVGSSPTSFSPHRSLSLSPTVNSNQFFRSPGPGASGSQCLSQHRNPPATVSAGLQREHESLGQVISCAAVLERSLPGKRLLWGLGRQEPIQAWRGWAEETVGSQGRDSAVSSFARRLGCGHEQPLSWEDNHGLLRAVKERCCPVTSVWTRMFVSSVTAPAPTKRPALARVRDALRITSVYVVEILCFMTRQVLGEPPLSCTNMHALLQSRQTGSHLETAVSCLNSRCMKQGAGCDMRTLSVSSRPHRRWSKQLPSLQSSKTPEQKG